MKRFISCLLAVALLLTLAVPVAMAADERKSGAFTYRIKGNGTAAITGYDWASMAGQDIFIPRMLDGYTVTEIADFAFSEVSRDTFGIPWRRRDESLTAGGLVIPDTVVSIGIGAFWALSFDTKVITIPASVQYIGSGAFANIDGIEQFAVASENPVYATIDGVLYQKKEKVLIAYPSEKANVQQIETRSGKTYAHVFNVPDGIKAIGDYAFFNTDFGDDGKESILIKYVTLPNTLESIGECAFAYTNIVTQLVARGNGGSGFEEHLILPNTLTELGLGAFYCATCAGSWNLVDLSATALKEIPALCFYDCSIVDVNDAHIKLPYSLETIGEFAFSKLSLQGIKGGSMRIPASVTTIKYGAFSGSSFERMEIATNSKLRLIEDYAFESAALEGKIVIPDGVETIGEQAFSECNKITCIKLPASVKKIGDDFCVRSQVYLDVETGSYAALWATENGYMVQPNSVEDTSWLTSP